MIFSIQPFVAVPYITNISRAEEASSCLLQSASTVTNKRTLVVLNRIPPTMHIKAE